VAETARAWRNLVGSGTPDACLHAAFVGLSGVFLHDGGDRTGYAYVSSTGHVGPLAVAQTREMSAAFRTALDLAAASGAAQVSAFLPGVSEALRTAVEHGMRITFPMVLASTRDFGDWTRYLPRNPGFM
jgi:hypothetical protein